MDFVPPDIIQRLGVALAIGLLMGLERGWEERDRAEGHRIAGFRTFGLISLLGGLSAVLAHAFDSTILAAAMLAVAAIFAVAQWYELKKNQDIGITTNIAAIAAFALGALAGHGAIAEAASSGVVATLLLGIKPEMHGLLQRIERTELLATLRLLLISVVVLPALPNKAVDPWNAINPFQVWLMVVLVAGISYLGYFAIKLTGPRLGAITTGFLGGLISSTATTVSLSRIGREHSSDRDVVAAGILVSTATMLPRTALVSSVIAPALFAKLAVPLAAGAACGYFAGLAYARRRKLPEATARDSPRNPLDLRTALQFALLLVVVFLLAHGAKERLGDIGLYGLATVSGLVDVDAVTLSLASMAEHGRTAVDVAARAIAIAAGTNVAIKAVIVFALGGAAMGIRILLGLSPMLIVMGLAFYLNAAAFPVGG